MLQLWAWKGHIANKCPHNVLFSAGPRLKEQLRGRFLSSWTRAVRRPWCGLAKIDMELDGVKLTTRAAVSDRLPVSVLLGTDIPELGDLLKVNPKVACIRCCEGGNGGNQGHGERQRIRAEETQVAKEKACRVELSPVMEPAEKQVEAPKETSDDISEI